MNADPAAEDRPAAPPAPAPFVPVADRQRIVALDVVRGFALLGIFLMNIEWFNRPINTMGEGLPRDATGLDWLAGWFVAYFVAGKFWTIFSLLFGMGFAVMLVRAEQAGRPFVRVYLRRILALATFGAAHYIFLWDGDILFSYAAGALGLMIVLYGKPRWILLAVAVFIGLGFLPEASGFFAVASGIAVTGLLGLYLRGQGKLRWKGLNMPWFSVILMGVGLAMSIAGGVLWLMPDSQPEPRGPFSVFGPLLVVTGWLSWKYHQPESLRSLRMAVTIYIFGGLAMTMAGVLQYVTPDPLVVAKAAAAAAAAAPATAAPTASAPAVAPSAAASSAQASKKKTPQQRVDDIRAERKKRDEERARDKAEQIRIFTTGRYADAVDLRARQFPDKAAGDGGFAVLLVGMFLLGAWFVRSGVMQDTERHLPFFRKLAMIGLPVGIGMGLVAASIATSHTPGDRHDGWGIAHGLLMLGNLPACLGYVGLVITLLHSRGFLSRIRVLAPLGRMALTNYLTQSLICSLFFYGYGLGHWGMPRAQQVLFVAIVYSAQVAFSHWWLARFNYGPMEWLWRGFTYRQVPRLRIDKAASPAAAQAV
jgi:uncharacterized membrane protein YeiB